MPWTMGPGSAPAVVAHRLLVSWLDRDADRFGAAMEDAEACYDDVLAEQYAIPYVAAERSYVDDVIEPADTRRVLVKGWSGRA
jgi:acetyl-CoA carboxylase carboxyltransferase component